MTLALAAVQLWLKKQVVPAAAAAALVVVAPTALAVGRDTGHSVKAILISSVERCACQVETEESHAALEIFCCQ